MPYYTYLIVGGGMTADAAIGFSMNVCLPARRAALAME